MTTIPTREEIAAVLTDLAEDLEAELKAHYDGTLGYPSEKRRYDRDMQPVERARDLLRRLDAPAPEGTPPDAGQPCCYDPGNYNCPECSPTGRAPSDADAQRVEQVANAIRRVELTNPDYRKRGQYLDSVDAERIARAAVHGESNG